MTMLRKQKKRERKETTVQLLLLLCVSGHHTIEYKRGEQRSGQSISPRRERCSLIQCSASKDAFFTSPSPSEREREGMAGQNRRAAVSFEIELTNERRA
jgi:hypothetical protein